MPRLTRPRRRPRRRAGFSLTELLVALTLLGIVGSMVAQVILQQARFTQRTSASMDVRRSLRTAMSTIPADLRSVSTSGGDLVSFTRTSVVFRSVIGASIACARPSQVTMDLPPLDMARNVLTSWYSEPQVGDSVFAFDEGILAGAEDDAWVGRRITGLTRDVSLCPLSPYTDNLLDANKPRFRVTVNANLPDSVKVGAGIRFVRSTRYQLVPGSQGRWYLSRAEYRGGAWGEDTPIAGPFNAPSAEGMRFAYFDSLGTEVTPGGNSRQVARIDLLLRAVSDSIGRPYRDSLTFRIALRNRQ